MNGIGAKLDKATRIKILASRAYKYNEKFDELEAQGGDPEQIANQLRGDDYQSRHTEDHKLTLPFDQNVKVINVSGNTEFGFDQAHKTLTNAQSQNIPVNSLMKKRTENKKTGKRDSGLEMHAKQKLNDEAMKKQIYMDHLADMFQKDEFTKPEASQYQHNYIFNDNMQKECDNQDFTYHQRKNDLKWYSEAYVKYKSTMRK